VLLLHGYPQTHAMWHKVAPRLAREYTVVCPDLRGYGDSSKPQGVPGHSNYSKRAMALDMVEVMESLGYFASTWSATTGAVASAHRMARDHGRRVRSLTVLDISPTLKMYQRTEHVVRQGLLPLVLPDSAGAAAGEMLRGHVPWYILARLGRGPSKLKHFDRRAVAEYVRAFKDPRTIHGTCEDYRASATIDLVHDRKDLQKKLRMPVLALWGRRA
jgi:haloacetate dehalogenase